MPNKVNDWLKTIPESDFEAAAEEAFVDAYGDHDKHTSVLTMIEDQLVFPFQAKVIGQEVSVVGMEWPDEEFGLNLIVEGSDGNRYPIAAQRVEPLKPLPEGIEFLALYLQWRARF